MRSPPQFDICYFERNSATFTAGVFILILFCSWRNLSFFHDKIVLLFITYFGYSCCEWLFRSINFWFLLLLCHALWVRCRVQYFSVYIFQTTVLMHPLFLHFSGAIIMVLLSFLTIRTLSAAFSSFKRLRSTPAVRWVSPIHHFRIHLIFSDVHFFYFSWLTDLPFISDVV